MDPSATFTRDQITRRIEEAFVEFGADPEKMRAEATLAELDIDSLDLFELGQILDQEFGIPTDPKDFEDVNTLGEAEAVMLNYLQ